MFNSNDINLLLFIYSLQYNYNENNCPKLSLFVEKENKEKAKLGKEKEEKFGLKTRLSFCYYYSVVGDLCID